MPSDVNKFDTLEEYTSLYGIVYTSTINNRLREKHCPSSKSIH